MVFDQGFKAKVLAVLTLGLIFGSGLGIGLAMDRDLIAGTPEAGTEAADEANGGKSGRGNRPMIVEQVGLSASQKTAVDETVVEQRQRMKVIQEEFKVIEREFNELYMAVIHDAREAIKVHLTDEQRDEYDVLLEEHDERRRERRENRRREHPIP